MEKDDDNYGPRAIGRLIVNIKATYVGDSPKYEKGKTYQWMVNGMTLYPLGLGKAEAYHSLKGFLQHWADIEVSEE